MLAREPSTRTKSAKRNQQYKRLICLLAENSSHAIHTKLDRLLLTVTCKSNLGSLDSIRIHSGALQLRGTQAGLPDAAMCPPSLACTRALRARAHTNRSPGGHAVPAHVARPMGAPDPACVLKPGRMAKQEPRRSNAGEGGGRSRPLMPPITWGAGGVKAPLAPSAQGAAQLRP